MASLVSLLDESARAYPDQTALCFRDREFTYREMHRRVDALAGALAGLGVGKGGFAAVVSANSNVTVEVLFACARLGAVCERYNVRLSPRVIAQLLARSEARVAFVSAALRPALAEALVGIGRTLMIVDVDGGAGAECGGVRSCSLLPIRCRAQATWTTATPPCCCTRAARRGCRAACCFRMARF